MKENTSMGKYDTQILELLSNEPKTPNEIAKKLNIHQKTAQATLMKLALTKPKIVGYKQVGRTHLFWNKIVRIEIERECKKCGSQVKQSVLCEDVDGKLKVVVYRSNCPVCNGFLQIPTPKEIIQAIVIKDAEK